MQRDSASRSAVPRLTGNAPSEEKSHPRRGYFHISCFPMNRMRRVLTHATIGVSM